jgi:Eisosome component PIL1
VGELEDNFIGTFLLAITKINWIDHYDQYRLTLKQIRNIQSSVQPSRDRKQKITDTIAHLKHKEPNSPRIVVLEQELVRAEAESLVAEAQLSNITREKLKAAFNYQFDAMREHSEKLALIAGYGKHLLDLIDDAPVTPGEARPAYDSYDVSKQIIVDCENALSEWTLDTASVKSTLSIRKPKKRTVQRGDGGGDLSQQDKPLERESSLWVPASEHEKVHYAD